MTLATLLLAPGCKRRTGDEAAVASAGVPGVTTISTPRALPAGCAVAVRLDLQALETVVGASGSSYLRAAPFASQAFAALAAVGVDISRDLRTASLCRIDRAGQQPGRDGRRAGGTWPTDLMDWLARGNGGLRRADRGGVPVLAGDGMWLLRRGAGELVFATGAAMFDMFMSGPAGSYPLDERSTLSMLLTGAGLKEALRTRSAARGAVLEAVDSVQIDLSRDGSSLTGLFVVKDEVRAGQLHKLANAAVTNLRTQLVSEGRRAPEIAVALQGTRLTMSGRLPPGTIKDMLSGLSAQLAQAAPAGPR